MPIELPEFKAPPRGSNSDDNRPERAQPPSTAKDPKAAVVDSPFGDKKATKSATAASKTPSQQVPAKRPPAKSGAVEANQDARLEPVAPPSAKAKPASKKAPASPKKTAAKKATRPKAPDTTVEIGIPGVTTAQNPPPVVLQPETTPPIILPPESAPPVIAATRAEPESQAAVEAEPADVPMSPEPRVSAGIADSSTPAPRIGGSSEITSAFLWAAVKTEPRRAPAALALATVTHYAAEAATQAAWLHATYPGVDVRRLVEVARHKASRRSWIATVASGPWAGLCGWPILLWVRGRLVLEIAAIFGKDPADARRAADLLWLLDVYADAGQAANAVSAVLESSLDVPSLNLRRSGLGVRAARGVAGRILPGVGMLIDRIVATAATEAVAVRAARYYAGESEQSLTV